MGKESSTARGTFAVPGTEPPPLPSSSELKYIGRSVECGDCREKVTGEARFTADVQLPGLQFSKLSSATLAHAGIASMDVSIAQNHPGVTSNHRIHAGLFLDTAVVREPSRETPSEWPVVRYANQPIVIVAAHSPEAAAEGAALVTVDYKPLPVVVDSSMARQPDAPPVFPGPVNPAPIPGRATHSEPVAQIGNVRGPMVHRTGDIAGGLREADVIVEGHFITAAQSPCALEPHAVVVDWKQDEMTVWMSTQSIAGVREQFAGFFQLPISQVRVIAENVAGGFAKKFDAGNPGVCVAAVSKKSLAPVSLVLSRKEDHLLIGYIPDSDQTLRIGAKKDGSLTALQLVSYGSAGCGAGAGCAGPAISMYTCGALDIAEYDVLTNVGPASVGGPAGYPQGLFALEQLVDELAQKLQIDPLDLRDRIDRNSIRRLERQNVRDSALWKSRVAHETAPATAAGPIRRGIGVAQGTWPCKIEAGSAFEIRIYRDGAIEAFSAVQDTGSGIRTVLAQIVAEEFSIPPHEIRIQIGDTRFPVGPPAGLGTTTASLTPAARNAAWQAKRQFLQNVAAVCGVTPDDLELKNGQILSRSGNVPSMSFREAAGKLTVSEISVRAERIPDYDPPKTEESGGVTVAEIEVDVELGRIRVRRVLAVLDCGRAINPSQIVGQVHGGVMRGLSQALFEERLFDPELGYMVNPDLERYKLAGARETPEIEVKLIQSLAGQSSTDATGIGGQAGQLAMSAAIANAFFNATGSRIRQTPMTPSQVLSALSQGPEKRAV
jgi:xanthine dehydrogenase YagR molybdenum-binding subunit